jgi:hypothetical protein
MSTTFAATGLLVVTHSGPLEASKQVSLVYSRTVSHVFSNPPQGNGSQQISAEEAKQLIRIHQNREAALEGSVTTQALAEALGLPVWQVEQMVRDMRNRPPMAYQPMSSATWLKKRLWIWALAAICVLGMVSALGPLGKALDGISLEGPGSFGGNRTGRPGIYRRSVFEQGLAFGMTAPPGFSYKIKYGTVEAAANGDSDNYVSSKNLSPASLKIVQEEYTRSILDGFDRAIKQQPPNWVNGEAVGEIRPNYYDAGFADPFDFPLKKEAFPYKADSPAGKEMHDRLLQAIQSHWVDIMD